MSIGRVSAGNGYEYLTRSVRNDAHDYYVGAGEAPGRWSGGGAPRLGLAGEVAEEEMALLFGAAAHPQTGEVLSTPYRHYRSIEERIAGKLEELGAGATVEDVTRIRAEQYRIGDRAPVAGYDCTFSPAKSVSALWALAPAAVRVEIEAAHDAAIDAAFGWLEQRALHTRAGRDGVRHLDAEGFIVARYRHRTNRNGDPQLHTHCAVANRVWSPTEERWRALDGQGLYRERAGADTVYMAAIEHELTARLGVGFEVRGEVREVATVPAQLVERWSSRRRQILDVYDERTGELQRSQTAKERSEALRAVTLETRQDKTRGGHIGLHDRWAREAAEVGVGWADVSATGAALDGALDRDETIGVALDAIEEQRAHWTYSQLAAELAKASGQALTPEVLRELADTAIRDGRVVTLAVADVGDDAPLRRVDGDSVYRDPHRQRYSTVAITDAEAFLAETADIDDAPVISRAAVKAHTAGGTLGVDQAAAVEQILAGPERITVVIGPAGTGKTHTQKAVVDIARRHGRQVFGLALSQNAADVLAAEAGCRCENIARTRFHGYDFPPGGIVIVDEAAMAGTLDLAWVAGQAHQARCKVVFVGDDRQLQSPSAGGIMRRLSASEHTVWLSEVRRFSSPWEAAATMALRAGDAGVAAIYEEHDRIRAGTRDEMVAAMVADWWEDQLAGRDTVMIAGDNDIVAELAAAARALRVAAGDVEMDGVILRDGTRAGQGDRIVTRKNNSFLRTERDRGVVNRDMWVVAERHWNGALSVVSERHGDRVLLPAEYVARHVELAYGATEHGVQGRTVDGGRALIDERTSRSGLYVAMTRGKHFNVGYGVLDVPSDTDERRAAGSGAALFAGVIGNDDRAGSALEVFAAELAASDSSQRLDAIRFDWVAVIADHLRGGRDLIAGDVVRAADRDNIGTVTSVDETAGTAMVHFVSPDGALADVELPGVDLSVERPAAVDWIEAGQARERAGDDPHLARMIDYLDVVDDTRRDKARRLAVEAGGAAWTVGVADDQIGDVAYYRDRWGITDDTPLGDEPAQQRSAQHRDWQRIQQHRPVGTLQQLAARRATDVDTTVVDHAMRRRRDALVAFHADADAPPAWATPLVGTSWSSGSGDRDRQRSVVAKAAIYRDRFGVEGDGLGPRPEGAEQVRIWRSLLTEATAARRATVGPDSAHTVARDAGAER